MSRLSRAHVQQSRGQQRRHHSGATNHPSHLHGFTACFAGSPCRFAVLVSNPGGGKIGGRSCECALFCTSISEKSIAGATADTGTLPLSAPQTPLNTCC